MYRQSLSDPDVVEKVVPTLFDYVILDAYFYARVAVTFEDGSTLEASTTSPCPMALPWEVTAGGRRTKTYNANISRALAWLTPRKAGHALSILRRGYTVLAADVDPYHDAASGKAWDEGIPHEENLHATLTRAGFPPPFHVSVVVLYEKGEVTGAWQSSRCSS